MGDLTTMVSPASPKQPASGGGGRGRRWRHHVARLLLICALGVTAAVAVGSSQPAAADWCQDAPRPVEPKSGVPGQLTAQPSPSDVPDTTADPFAKDAKVGIGDVYGYNWVWYTYDLGCGSDMLRDPLAVVNTVNGSATLSFSAAVVAGLDSLEKLATADQMSWAMNVVGNVAGSLKDLVLGNADRKMIGWLPLAAVALGIFIAFRARRSSHAQTFQTLLIFGGALLLTVYTLVFPYTASKAVDDGAKGIAQFAGAGFNGSIADTVNRGSPYRTWLAGNFGDPDSDLAQRLGPRLTDATHYSWSDMKRIDADPAARTAIDETKAAEFKAVAAEVKAASPTAYETFQGRTDRSGPALFALLLTVCMSLFAFMAMIMTLVGRVMMQALVLAAPLGAVLGILPPGHVVLQKMWGLFTSAVVTIAKFTIAAGVMGLVLGGLASLDRPSGESVFWIIVATIVGLSLTKPVRSFKGMMPGLDPNHSYVRSLMSGVMAAAGASQGASGAIDAATKVKKVGDRGSGHATDEPGENGSRQIGTAPASTESLPPLDEPKWVQVQTTPAAQSARHLGPAGASRRYEAESEPAPRWAGVLHAENSPRALPAAPSRSNPTTTAPAITATTVTTTTEPASPVRALPEGSTSRDVPSADPTTTATSRSATPVGAPATGGSSQAGGLLVEERYIYPTGIIVPKDPTLYQGHTPAASGDAEYIRLSEPELDADGHEQDVVIYQSGRKTPVRA